MELTRFFQEHPKAAIAFSGGVDSAYLLYAAAASGAQVTAYFVKTQFQPAFELEDAKVLAEALGLPLKILTADILCQKIVVSNPPDRCYHCKKHLFSVIRTAAMADGYPLLLDGTNASDDASHRPGMKVLSELSVRSPLRECGLTKEQIRSLSKQAGLFTHNKPAYACLATRIPTGELITAEKLAKTEAAEAFLASLGFRDFRLRIQGSGAKLQLREDDLPLVLKNRIQILEALKPYYDSLVLDLEVRP